MFPSSLGTGYGGMGLGAISLADAIAKQENVNPAYNNPGALTAAPSRYCQTGKTGILVNFCTKEDGLDALNNQISLNANRGMTLDSFFASYAPAASGNDPVTYANNVAGWTGIDPSVPLNTVDAGSLFSNYNSVDVVGVINDLVGGSGTSGIDWTLVAGIGLIALYLVTR